MTLDEVKEKLGSLIGTGPEQVMVEMSPKEGNFFILTVTMMAAELPTRILIALLDLGRDAGMDLSIQPISDESLNVVFRKDSVEFSL